MAVGDQLLKQKNVLCDLRGKVQSQIDKLDAPKQLVYCWI